MRELRILDEKIEGIHECLRFVEVNSPFQWEVWCEFYPGVKENADKCPPGLVSECQRFFLVEIQKRPRMSQEEFISNEWNQLLDKWASLHPEHSSVWSDWWYYGGVKRRHARLLLPQRRKDYIEFLQRLDEWKVAVSNRPPPLTIPP